MDTESPLLRVMALHALAYCERLFYLEEVEEIRVADQRVYAGRTLHEQEVDVDGEWDSVTLESETWGLRGKADYVRHRDGSVVVFEHKRGRAPRTGAWPSDRLQVIAYAVLIAEHLGRPISEGRVRYHASNRTVKVAIDDEALADLRAAIARGGELAATTARPPITTNERLCAKCSLAPVCLPEEERLLRAEEESRRKAARLFPEDDERRTLHIVDPGTRVGRSGEQIVVTSTEGEETRVPGRDIAAVVLHGGAQVTSQMIHFAAAHDIAVHWLTAGGQYVAGVIRPGGVQRRIRQFEGLRESAFALELARRLARAKIENQMKFLMRAARGKLTKENLGKIVQRIEIELRGLEKADNCDSLRGREGMAARWYFFALPGLLREASEQMKFSGRNRRPPRDPFNAALSFGYSLLYRDLVASIVTVGLDPSFGFFHRPRTAAYPLALDLMELFRTVLWDMPLVASVNRRQWREEHFSRTREQVWLSAEGRKQAIALYENRKQEHWKHPVLGYSLSYSRAMELEVRLLEKEWSGSPGLFGNMRLRG
jgi:CRISPR-associated protein Cas1